MPERKKFDVEELVQKITLAENYAKIDISKGRNTLVDDLAELGSYSRILLRLMKDWAEKEQTTEMNQRMQEIANNIARRRDNIRMKLRDQVYSAIKTEIMTAINFIIRLLERSRTSINEQLISISNRTHPQSSGFNE